MFRSVAQVFGVGTSTTGSGFLVNSSTFVTSGHVVSECKYGFQIVFHAINRRILLACDDFTISEDKLFAFARLPRRAREYIEQSNIRFFHPAPEEIISEKLAIVVSYTLGSNTDLLPALQLFSTVYYAPLTVTYDQAGIEELEALYSRDYAEFKDSLIFIMPPMRQGMSGSPLLRVHDDGSFVLIGMAELTYHASRVDLLMHFLDIHNISWE